MGCEGFLPRGYVLRLLAISRADCFFGRFDLLDLRAMQSLGMGHASGGSICSRNHKGLIDAAFGLTSVCASSGTPPHSRENGQTENQLVP